MSCDSCSGSQSSVFVLCCISELAALVGLVDYRTLIGPNHAWKFRSVADPELGSIRRPYTHKKGSALGVMMPQPSTLPHRT
jgi:hypothetical protein